MRPKSLQAADFQQVLGTRPVSRTEHFFLYVLRQLPPPNTGGSGGATALSPAASPQRCALAPDELSTGALPQGRVSVDDSMDGKGSQADTALRLGLVIPKKQARRAVTRSLIRHQARAALARFAQQHPQARLRQTEASPVVAWVVRLRSPFDRQQYPSAASTALAQVVRSELDDLWRGCLGPQA